MRSISSLIEVHTAPKWMPIEPSSAAGLTITGNWMSCACSVRPRNTVAK